MIRIVGVLDTRLLFVIHGANVENTLFENRDDDLI